MPKENEKSKNKLPKKVTKKGDVEHLARIQWAQSQMDTINNSSVSVGIVSDMFVPNNQIHKLTKVQRTKFVEYVLYWIVTTPGIYSYRQYWLDGDTPKPMALNYFKHLLYDDDTYKEYKTAIKSVCEQRLVHGGLLNKLNPGMTKFILSNNYNYSEKSEQKITHKMDEVKFNYDNIELNNDPVDIDFEEINPEDEE